MPSTPPEPSASRCRIDIEGLSKTFFAEGREVLAVDNANVPDTWAASQLPDVAANGRFGIVAALTHSEAGLRFLPQLRSAGVHAPVMASASAAASLLVAPLLPLTSTLLVAELPPVTMSRPSGSQVAALQKLL